jgi:hypothetical protein
MLAKNRFLFPGGAESFTFSGNGISLVMSAKSKPDKVQNLKHHGPSE